MLVEHVEEAVITHFEHLRRDPHAHGVAGALVVVNNNLHVMPPEARCTGPSVPARHPWAGASGVRLDRPRPDGTATAGPPRRPPAPAGPRLPATPGSGSHGAPG